MKASLSVGITFDIRLSRSAIDDSRVLAIFHLLIPPRISWRKRYFTTVARSASTVRYTAHMQTSAKVMGVTILVLSVLTAWIWFAVAQATTGRELSVTFLNIGQGDAVFIQSPSGAQVLIDGGKNRTVLRELSRVMPLFDRSLDVVIGTHPDADHIGGLPDVLKRYTVSLVVQSSVLDIEGVDSAAFEGAIDREEGTGAVVLEAKRGQIIDLGEGAWIEILFPDRPVPNIETNTGSIIARLVYGDTSFMLTGDSPKEIEQYLVLLDGVGLDSTILKAGHHGSRTSSSLSFVGFVSPEYTVISRGCDNTYGHPHEEVMATMARLDVLTLDTCLDGRVTFISDGRRVVRK